MKENRSNKTSEKGRGNRSADGLRCWLDLNWPYLVLCCGFFGICLYCSCNILVTEAPDEYARHLVSAYIFQTGSLPTGLEPETRIPIWGFSYALNPYLAQIFSACFMRAMSLVSADPSALVIAARFVSVISGTISIFVMCKIGELFFDGQRLPALLPGLLLAALPQFLFISSYENNDVFSIFCCLLVTYCWFRAWKRGWSLNLCLGLGISIGLLALSYYNAYGFILLSIPVFFILPMRQSGSRGVSYRTKGFLIVLGSSLLVAGWFFIRNIVLLQGDMFGLVTRDVLFDSFGSDLLKPPLHVTPQEQGLSFLGTFYHSDAAYGWWRGTIQSLFCNTGYLSHPLSDKLLWVYILMFFLGLVLLAIAMVTRVISLRRCAAVGIPLFVCVVIPVLLSQYYSYATDWQAQGRYIMSAMVPVILFVATGCRTFGSTATVVCDAMGIRTDPAFSNRLSTVFVVLFAIGYLLLFALCFTRYLLPCFSSIPLQVV